MIGAGEYYCGDTTLVELNPQEKPVIDLKRTWVPDKYQRLIVEDAACSACYSSLIFALHRLNGNPRARGKIHIGQGFKGKRGAGVGIGNCTRGFEKCVPGCPPKATEIAAALGDRSVPHL
jgi:hypothetical protein